MSPRRPTASQVGDDHIGMAASPRKPVIVVGSFADAEVTLHMPRLPTGTAAQKARAARHEAEERKGAVDELAWMVKLAHDCPHVHHGDPPCRKRAHKGDVKAAAVMLDMLGLRDGAPKGKRGGPRRFE